MSLADALNAFKAQFRQRAQEIQAKMRAAEARVAAEAGKSRLKTGRRPRIRTSNYQNARGEPVTLRSVLQRGPVVASASTAAAGARTATSNWKGAAGPP